MILSQAPTLGTINGGAGLVALATKLQNISMVAWTNTHSNIKRDRLIAFWKDQKDRVALDHGLPSDGLYLAPGVLDIRKDCYHVLSQIRLSGNTIGDVAAWNTFCDYFIMAADSLRDSHSAVASIEIRPAYEESNSTEPDNFTNNRAIFWVTMKDAIGNLVPMSHDVPGLGKLVPKYVNEGTPTNMNKWREEAGRFPTTNPFLFDHGNFTSPPSTVVTGKATIEFKYEADVTPVVTGTAEYWRKQKPTSAPPVEPEAKAEGTGKNGI